MPIEIGPIELYNLGAHVNWMASVNSRKDYESITGYLRGQVKRNGVEVSVGAETADAFGEPDGGWSPSTSPARSTRSSSSPVTALTAITEIDGDSCAALAQGTLPARRLPGPAERHRRDLGAE